VYLTLFQKLVSCKPTTEASKAFELLIDAHVSAVPVLDDSGHLITSFSAGDLKGAEVG
jgi:CBS domain-containing protein